MFRSSITVKAVLALAVVSAVPTLAHAGRFDRDDRFDRGQRYEHRDDRDADRHADVHLDVRDRGYDSHPVLIERPIQVWVEPVYRTVTDRQWVAPVYRTVIDRVWVEPTCQKLTERVWVPDRYEERQVTCRGRVTRQRVLVACAHWEARIRDVITPGHYQDFPRQELVCDGHWETVTRQELVTPAHYEPCPREVIVERPRQDSHARIDIHVGWPF